MIICSVTLTSEPALGPSITGLVLSLGSEDLVEGSMSRLVLRRDCTLLNYSFCSKMDIPAKRLSCLNSTVRLRVSFPFGQEWGVSGAAVLHWSVEGLDQRHSFVTSGNCTKCALKCIFVFISTQTKELLGPLTSVGAAAVGAMGSGCPEFFCRARI
jgi:hypothetical protein